jgi:hypothetical protein
MMTQFIRRLGPLLLGAAVAIIPAPARAQQQQPQPTEFDAWHIPGWTFTPGIVVGGLFDTNVTLLAKTPAQGTASDRLFQFEPFGQVEYFSPRATLTGGYRGAVRRYVDLDELNSVDHRAFLALRDRVTRRVTIFLTENFAQVPTTDRLQLNGVPFQRSGARYNDVSGGVEARLTRSTDFTTRYDLTWVDFDREDTLLTGGIVNGIRSSLSHRFTERTSFGGEYQFRWADLNGGPRQQVAGLGEPVLQGAEPRLQVFQDAGMVVRYRVAEATDFEAAGGIAHLDDRSRGVTRTGPYVRVELVHHARRATIGGEFQRSYVPSVAFGGTNQTETVRGYVQMPLNHNRFYVQESATWHRSNPLDPAVLPLQSIWLNSVLGYSIQRWLRIEGYHALSTQDTRLAGGRINRQVVGVQFVISEPMRIR